MIKKKYIVFPVVIFSSFVFAQNNKIGINTSNPKGIFHVDGAGDNPLVGDFISTSKQSNDFIVKNDGKVGIGVTEPKNILHVKSNIDPVRIEGLQEKSSVTNTDRLLMVDSNGVLIKVNSLDMKGALYNLYYVQGKDQVTIASGETKDVSGLLVKHIVPKGQKQILTFNISAYVSSNDDSAATGIKCGQGVFSLVDEQNNKITSSYASYYSQLVNIRPPVGSTVTNSVYFVSKPVPVTILKSIIIDNTNGVADISKIFKLRYKAWYTVSEVGQDKELHLVNKVPTNFAGYDQDNEAMISKMTVYVYNM